MPVICEGCGRPVVIPEGYRRNKIQCPCGVICPVPEAARQEAEAAPARPRPAPAARTPPAAEEQAESWLLEDEPPAAERPSEPPRFRDPEPEEPPAAAAAPAAPAKRFPCRRCGRLIARQRECPSCDGVPSQQTDQEPVWWPSVDEPETDAEEEDGSPYGVEGTDEVRCPECSFVLPPGSVLCVRCGFHFRRRKKVVKTYEPMDIEWETNYPLQARLAFFAACELAALALGLLGVFWGGAALAVFEASFLLLTLMLGFLLGTYPRVRMTRDARGRVKLTKTWRACFIPLQPETTDARGFEGIVSGQHCDVKPMDYVLLLVLTGFGLVPGMIWYYLAFHKVTFHVSLSRDHGHPAYLVYSGWDEKQMREIAYRLRDATGLPYDEG